MNETMTKLWTFAGFAYIAAIQPVLVMTYWMRTKNGFRPNRLHTFSNDFHIDYYIRKDLKRLFMKKLAEEKTVDRKNTIIILIKVSVYDYLFKELRRNGYKVCDVRIPFPSTGNQKRFAEAMLKVEEELKGL